LLSLVVSDFVRMVVGGSDHGLEPSNQRLSFPTLTVLSWWLFDYACEVFDEMSVSS
jgi:hypothetical protein